MKRCSETAHTAISIAIFISIGYLLQSCYIKLKELPVKTPSILTVIIFSIFTSFLTGYFTSPRNSNILSTNNNAYDRVMKTKTLRCGYAVWPPAIYKDPKTNEAKGAFAEIAEEMAKNMGVKLVWAEETGWGSFIEGLESGRFDAFCAPLWINAERGMRVSYTIPFAYSAQHLYTRKDDYRFDNDISILNSEQYTLATMDGEAAQSTIRRFFPNVKKISIPQLGDTTQLILAITTRKADGAFLEPSLAKDFASKNPNQIRQATKEPFSVFPITFGIKIGEDKLQNAMNGALTEMLNQGVIDHIIEKTEPDRSIYMPVRKPYESITPKELP
jgi:polar amino acid transport system substrate-binding protein